MGKITEILINNSFKVLAGVLILTLAFGQVRSCSNTQKLYTKIGILQESMANTQTAIGNLTKENAKLREQNAIILSDTKKLKEDSAKANVEIKAGLDRIHKLEANRPPVLEECKPIVAAMQSEIDEWSRQFSLAIADRDTWKTIADNFNLAYQNQVVITTNLQNTITLIAHDSALKDDIIKDLQKQVSKGNTSVKLLTIGVFGALIVFIMGSIAK